MTIRHTLNLTEPDRNITLDRNYEGDTVRLSVDNGVHLVSVDVPTEALRELVKLAGL